jgi:hypothetical protein
MRRAVTFARRDDGRTRPLRVRGLTIDVVTHTYLDDYALQRYRTMTTARARVEHLHESSEAGRRGHHGRRLAVVIKTGLSSARAAGKVWRCFQRVTCADAVR